MAVEYRKIHYSRAEEITELKERGWKWSHIQQGGMVVLVKEVVLKSDRTEYPFVKARRRKR